MRFTHFIAVLPVLAAAQEQIPLADRVQGWFNKAKSLLPTATPVIPVVEQVVEPKKVQEKAKAAPVSITVAPFNETNWRSYLEPSSEAQDWLIYVTGGNKTCFGRCERADKAWNESLPLFAADSTSPKLGYVNCEENQLMCSTWAAGAPTVWHFQVPQAQPGQERAPTPLHVVHLNTTTVDAERIYKLHSEKAYADIPAYEGQLHPLDGWLAQYGLLTPLGYVLYFFGVVPSWLFMITVSFFSRTMMGRRMSGGMAPPAPRRG